MAAVSYRIGELLTLQPLFFLQPLRSEMAIGRKLKNIHLINQWRKKYLKFSVIVTEFLSPSVIE